LAIWFAEAENDAAAHRLFRAAFACSPARHLQLDDQTLEQRDQAEQQSDSSWLDARPVHVAPQLRSTGRQPVGSANRRIIDRSAEREAALHRLNIEWSREESSRETLIALGRIRLADIGAIDSDTFRLLMELIEQAVPRPGSDGSASAVHRDGSLRVQVTPAEESALAVVETEEGMIRMRDMWLEVTRAREL
jgi:uncharacterized protein (TIGR02677 family)